MGTGARKKASPPSMWERRETLRSEAGRGQPKQCLISFCSYPSLPFFSRPRVANPTGTSESKTTLQGIGPCRQSIMCFSTVWYQGPDAHPRLVCCLQTEDETDFADCWLGIGKRNTVTSVVDIGRRCWGGVVWLAGPHPKSGCRDGAGDSDDMDEDSVSSSSTVAQTGQAQRLISLAATASDLPSTATLTALQHAVPVHPMHGWGGKTRVGESPPRAAFCLPSPRLAHTLSRPGRIPLRYSRDCLGTWRSPCLRPMRSAAQPQRWAS